MHTTLALMKALGLGRHGCSVITFVLGANEDELAHALKVPGVSGVSGRVEVQKLSQERKEDGHSGCQCRRQQLHLAHLLLIIFSLCLLLAMHCTSRTIKRLFPG
jgi:hypothetical protein